jgi:hypothetical protein
MLLRIDPKGHVRCLYTEALDLRALGPLTISRASQVEPDDAGLWWADLTVSGGPCLGPFDQRSQALNAERAWLEAHLLSCPPAPTGTKEAHPHARTANHHPASLDTQ